MNRLRRSTLTALLVVLSVSISTVSTSAQVRDLGLEAFLNQFSPFASQTWIDPANGNFLRIDAYGKLNTSFNLGLPTTLAGKVTARDLGDGTEQVTVLIHTRDAICWGSNGNTEPATPMFGYAPQGVVSGVGPAALGDITYRLVFAPQPAGQFDLGMADLETWFGTANCDGQLREGTGYPNGTEGFAQTTQTGVLSTGAPGGCPPEKDADCFPAEKVQFKPVGN